MAVVFTLKAGTTISADETPILKILKINKRTIEVQSLEVGYENIIDVDVGKPLASPNLAIDIMPTKVYLGQNSTVRMSCKSHNNDVNFTHK